MFLRDTIQAMKTRTSVFCADHWPDIVLGVGDRMVSRLSKALGVIDSSLVSKIDLNYNYYKESVYKGMLLLRRST